MTDILSQLKGNTAITEPVPPPRLNAGLKELVGDLDNFSSLPYDLQRAMLWSSGWVRAIPEGASSSSGSDASDQYVQVYVLCGSTMSNIFLPTSTFEDWSACPIKTCKANNIAYTETTCEPSYVESKSLCALSPEAVLEPKSGPLWSKEGHIDEKFDPQLFRFDNGAVDNTTIYMLTQTSSWYMDDDTCPNSAAFIAPCRQIDAGETDLEESEWCIPEIDQWVYEWVLNEMNSSGSTAEFNSDTNSTLTVPAIVGIIVACGVLIVIIGGGFVLQSRFTDTNQYRSGLWDDEVIISNKIPREKVKTLKLISRGAFGEVYTVGA
ncbi:hypothetical protein V7S43_015988 [Phytophthora oleae]|uniref:Protein kinase domain-containing protein n=1 Tax=Phytophthora oleae TaxID=2107226 RepID=A0ABD3F1V2_9STRA